jgi:hypothetical protein
MVTSDPGRGGKREEDRVIDLRPPPAGTARAAAVQQRCDDLASRVAALAEEANSLWRDALPDGDLAFRLVEASQSLHRASLALGANELLGLEGA